MLFAPRRLATSRRLRARAHATRRRSPPGLSQVFDTNARGTCRRGGSRRAAEGDVESRARSMSLAVESGSDPTAELLHGRHRGSDAIGSRTRYRYAFRAALQRTMKLMGQANDLDVQNEAAPRAQTGALPTLPLASANGGDPHAVAGARGRISERGAELVVLRGVRGRTAAWRTAVHVVDPGSARVKRPLPDLPSSDYGDSFYGVLVPSVCSRSTESAPAFA